MAAQNRTLEQYHNWMQVNAASHLIRAARTLGILRQLSHKQHTLAQLCESLSLQPDSAGLLMDSLVAIGIVERYGDDFAVSQAARLLCLYDEDLGDARWQQLVDRVRGSDHPRRPDNQRQYDFLAATQWIHTQAAMQAAEILDIGGQTEPSGPAILDLGCGSAVWSCAMAHRDSEATITAVDNPAALEAAHSTASSIDLQQRFKAIAADPIDAELPADAFDLVLVAQRVSCLDDESAERLIGQAVRATRPGGRVALIDLFRGPGKPDLSECAEALIVHLETKAGYLRSLQDVQMRMRQAGLEGVQFTFLAASKVNMGMAVGIRSRASAAGSQEI